MLYNADYNNLNLVPSYKWSKWRVVGMEDQYYSSKSDNYYSPRYSCFRRRSIERLDVINARYHAAQITSGSWRTDNIKLSNETANCFDSTVVVGAPRLPWASFPIVRAILETRIGRLRGLVSRRPSSRCRSISHAPSAAGYSLAVLIVASPPAPPSDGCCWRRSVRCRRQFGGRRPWWDIR